ncbi:PREDICTED: protein PHLOEM PROTEIN 2-LIKE A9-like isoform X2 [Populus euphratica]|uniref:Protein PHLOEM PROTEIN 2-LIKE A9-like isoform X2 n=1 Tax=Populus euphratica TaxID=75702 RepID=A0AAJ6SX94_POPEU|nr:PREDICTED: protein PHLOEM PROTEIN 2-LIKE A9-like isoform X2 [Populus euphratica]
MSFLSKSSSQGASKGSKAPPSKHVSKGDEGTGSSFPSISSNMKNLFGRRSKGSKASSDSQQPSPNNENPEPAFSQAGKTTFKPKNLSIFSEEESQAWTISERDGPAELQEVCWLDVTGSMTATKGKAYEISFILSMNEKNSFGWEDPVYVMARIGEKGEYTRVKIDLSKLGLKEEEFPEEKCRVDFRSDENSENNKKTLYFGLYEVWTNHWKGGLRIHEAIVREVTAEDSASTSNTRSDDSKVQEVTADNSTSASESALDKGCFEGQNLFPMPTSRNFQ